MPEGRPVKKAKGKASPKATAPAAPADDDTDMAEWFEGDGGQIVPLGELAWDLDTTRGQARSLDADYVEELQGNILDNGPIDYLQVYLWNAGAFGMLCSYPSCAFVVHVLLSFMCSPHPHILAENRSKKYYLLSGQHITRAMFNVSHDKQRAGERVNDYYKSVRAVRILKTATPLHLRQLLSGKLQRQQRNRCSSIGSLAVHLHRCTASEEADLEADDVPEPLSGEVLRDCYYKSGLDLPELGDQYKDLDKKGDEYGKIMVCALFCDSLRALTGSIPLPLLVPTFS